MKMERNGVIEGLFEVNPYFGFDSSGFESDIQGWG